MNDSDRTNWLNCSAPLPIDGEEPQAPTDRHTTRVRDLRHRFGDPDHPRSAPAAGAASPEPESTATGWLDATRASTKIASAGRWTEVTQPSYQRAQSA
jgi:hypothetical protein